MRTRRPFTASVMDAVGNEILRVRRPMFLINSSIYIEVDGEVVGECHRRWHLWRRNYDVYLGYSLHSISIKWYYLTSGFLSKIFVDFSLLISQQGHKTLCDESMLLIQHHEMRGIIRIL
jgi:uncharacterized protein YxjI